MARDMTKGEGVRVVTVVMMKMSVVRGGGEMKETTMITIIVTRG